MVASLLIFQILLSALHAGEKFKMKSELEGGLQGGWWAGSFWTISLSARKDVR